MSDAQIQAWIPSIATLILVAAGILYNSSKISDLSTLLSKRIGDLDGRRAGAERGVSFRSTVAQGSVKFDPATGCGRQRAAKLHTNDSNQKTAN